MSRAISPNRQFTRTSTKSEQVPSFKNLVTMNAKSTTFLRRAFLTMALFIWGGNAVYAQNTTPFVTTWEVAAGSLGLTIPIPTSGNFTYSYTVDWGDSSADTTTHTGDATHTYTTPGVYTVSISGTFPSFYFCDSKMKTIKQWGDNPWKSMGGAFQNCQESYYRINRRKPQPFQCYEYVCIFLCHCF